MIVIQENDDEQKVGASQRSLLHRDSGGDKSSNGKNLNKVDLKIKATKRR